MASRMLFLSKVFIQNILRQRSVLFSSFILPAIVIWSTWWITAEFPMEFSLALTGELVSANMLDVHVITGGLTAMGITAGLFSFILTTENNKIQSRLKLFNYSSLEINLASLIALIIVLSFSTILTTLLSLALADEKNAEGIAIGIAMTTIIYTLLGNLLGNIYPKMTEGTLIMLIFTFVDLMLLTNPMGEGLYLATWTHYLPGFWPVQIALESGFIGFPDRIFEMISYVLAYAVIIIIVNQLLRSDIAARVASKVRGLL